MRYLGWILLGLLGMECFSIFLVSDWIGSGWTLLLMFISFISGIMMLRYFGFSAILLAAASLRSGPNLSLYQLLWPIRYIVAAFMLMSPGFFSDIIALILLWPIAGSKKSYQNNTAHEMDSDIIDGEYTVQTEKSSNPVSQPHSNYLNKL